MRGIGYLHRQFHKFFPPSIPSPYLYGPFGRALKRILREHASKAKTAVEFGILNGYTTTIIADAILPGGKLYAYDALNIPDLSRKITRRDIRVHLERKFASSWVPFDFDFMWIDVGATEDYMWILHQKLKPYLKNSVVLSEGTHRRGSHRIKCIPSVDLCTIPPGIFRLLP